MRCRLRSSRTRSPITWQAHTETEEVTIALRLAVGADNAGYVYKEAIKKDFEGDQRVVEVVDVGVVSSEEGTYHPNVAVAAAEKIASGVDGLFVGRSAWQVEGFLELLDIAADHARSGETR